MAVLDLHWRPQYVGSAPAAQELGWALHNKNVRFGSEADVRKQKFMSASPPKADMCSATRDVRFVPLADIDAKGQFAVTSNPNWLC